MIPGSRQERSSAARTAPFKQVNDAPGNIKSASGFTRLDHDERYLAGFIHGAACAQAMLGGMKKRRLLRCRFAAG